MFAGICIDHIFSKVLASRRINGVIPSNTPCPSTCVAVSTRDSCVPHNLSCAAFQPKDFPEDTRHQRWKLVGSIGRNGSPDIVHDIDRIHVTALPAICFIHPIFCRHSFVCMRSFTSSSLSEGIVLQAASVLVRRIVPALFVFVTV